jgi:hypothetical protein
MTERAGDLRLLQGILDAHETAALVAVLAAARDNGRQQSRPTWPLAARRAAWVTPAGLMYPGRGGADTWPAP